MRGNNLSLALMLWLAAVSGCQRSGVEVAQDPAATTTSTPSPQTVEVQSGTPGGSPADLSPARISGDASPGEVCEKFLNLLAAGEISDAERLLSKRSAIVTRQAGLVLSAPAGRSSRFEFDPPQFANTKQKRAMVMCRVIETASPASGVPASAMSWMLSHENEGWRITGLVLLEDEQPADLLSFENPADVEQIRELLAGDAPVRQASGEAPVSR